MLRTGIRPTKLFTIATTGRAPRCAASTSAGWNPEQHQQTGFHANSLVTLKKKQNGMLMNIQNRYRNVQQ